jgi:hypothetical protein
MYTVPECPVSMGKYRANAPATREAARRHLGLHVGRKNLGARDPRIDNLEVIDWDIFALKMLEGIQGLIKDIPYIGEFLDGILNAFYPAVNLIVIKGLEAEIKKELEFKPDQPVDTGTIALFLSDSLGEWATANGIFEPEFEIENFEDTFTYEFIMSYKTGPVYIILFGDKAMNITGKVTEVILNIMNLVLGEIAGVEPELPPEEEDPAVKAWLAGIQTKMNTLVNGLSYFTVGEVDAKFNQLWPTVEQFMEQTKPAVIDAFGLLTYKTSAKQQLKAALESKAKTGTGGTNMRYVLMPKDYERKIVEPMKIAYPVLHFRPGFEPEKKNGLPIVPLAIGGVALYFLFVK